MSTPNTGIPYVPEGTQDPAAGLNLSLNVIDALLQTAVIDMDRTAPPGSPNDGDMHIVATGATGAWAGEDNNLARYVAEGDFWQFFTAGVQVKLILNVDDGGLYKWDGAAWVLAAGLGDAPADGTGYVRKDGAWEPESGGGGGAVSSVNGQTGVVQIDAEDVPYSNTTSGLAATDVQGAIDELAATPPGPAAWGTITGTLSDQTDLQAAMDAKAGNAYTIVTEASPFTADPGTHDGLSRLILAGGDVTFDDAEPYTAGMTFNIRATAAIELIEDGVTLTPPASGTLEIDANMAVQVVMTGATTGIVIGQTVPA